MRRGFKAWCETTAKTYRAALNLKPADPLNPEDLATHLDVVVWRPEDIPELCNGSLQRLTVHDKDSWSAVTLQHGRTNLTIVNSAHSKQRQRSSLCHELSHLILEHEPGRLDLSPKGHLLLNSYEKEQEAEADWLSSTLLVPRTGLQIAFRSTQSPEALADRFGVSVKMLNWRLRMTGVKTQAQRARKFNRRKKQRQR